MHHNLIHYKKYMTNFHDQEIKYTDDDNDRLNSNKLYSLDSNGQMHLNLIPGILRLSSKKFKTTHTNGYIMKEFDPVFGILPTFMVKTNKLKDNVDKYVIVRIIHSTDQKTASLTASLTGTVERYIGDIGDIDVEKNLCKIISTCHWSKKIEKMNDVELGISTCDQTPLRIDMTLIPKDKIITVSVDPLGSCDIDDAISFEMKSDTECEIGIHIADPTSYIIENSILDKEIAKRCESVYLKNDTIHMFPYQLSTKTFSLNQNQKNRSFSVILGLNLQNMNWHITTKKITKTIIRVDRNMTYGQFDDEHEYDTMLNTLYGIGKYLYKTILDPQDIVLFESKKMIEIFMVIANNCVAEKMIELSNCEQLSHVIIRAQKIEHTEYLINEIHARNPLYQEFINSHLQIRRRSGELRIFSKLTPESNKHYSLNLNLYTHFTSPIRRYSDILVHRLLYNLISGTEVFKLLDAPDRLHQLFLMNHYKKYYKLINQLEQDIIITHHVIRTIPDPWDRIWNVRGVIIDLREKKNNRTKIIVKCMGLCEAMGVDNNVSQYLMNTTHTLWVETQDRAKAKDQEQDLTKAPDQGQDKDQDKFTLFETIQFKVCFLSKDIRKIRSYV